MIPVVGPGWMNAAKQARCGRLHRAGYQVTIEPCHATVIQGDRRRRNIHDGGLSTTSNTSFNAIL
jgi:hypothetical protein